MKKFKTDISNIEIPQQFTYPLYYTPHLLCKIAAEELQDYLNTQKEWEHDFGINKQTKNSLGKMFGVLVVKNKNNELGYLWAFSGKLAETNILPDFVPPVYDILHKNSFYKIEEEYISEINKKIESLENSEELNTYKTELSNHISNVNQIKNAIKKSIKDKKTIRKLSRQQGLKHLTQAGYENLCDILKKQSIKEQYDYKRLKKYLKEKQKDIEKNILNYNNKINSLKEERKQRSLNLQFKLFNKYILLNGNGKKMNVTDIFKNYEGKIPPAGTGECAAPKLLNHAFKNNLKPIAMAEFWWGQTPISEIRKHKMFYPPCRSKCKPLLQWMLQGIDVEPNPLLSKGYKIKSLEIIYEDDDIIAINKPCEFLSVPGKDNDDSVLSRLQNKYSNGEYPLLVHRLDMSTSGVLIAAKNKFTHKELQKQFQERKIKKNYIALLDGVVKNNEGKIKLPIRVDLDDRPRQLVCYEHGKTAITNYKVLAVADGKTRISLSPITGRTHQLRVHCAHHKGLNCSIIGDELYGKPNDRLYLHAESIKFTHPKTGKKIKIKCEADF